MPSIFIDRPLLTAPDLSKAYREWTPGVRIRTFLGKTKFYYFTKTFLFFPRPASAFRRQSLLLKKSGGNFWDFLDFGRNHVQPESLANDAARRDGPRFVFQKFEFEQSIFGVLGGKFKERIVDRLHFGRAPVARIGPETALPDREFEDCLLSALLNLVSSQDFFIFFGQKLVGGLSGLTRIRGRKKKNPDRDGGDDQGEPLFFRQHGRILTSIFDLDKKYE
jgi:hypothetical protein